jgi:hypothetical protein
VDPLPEIGDLVPTLDGTFIEHRGYTYFKGKTSQLPAHDLVRIGWRLYTVGGYNTMLDAWEVQKFTIDTSDEATAEWLANGD